MVDLRFVLTQAGPLAGLPLRLLPAGPLAYAITQLLNRLFAEAIAQGQLDFLNAHRVRIQIDDLDLAFTLHFEDRRLRALVTRAAADVCIRASTLSLLQLALQRVDQDTLFFQRKLHIDGAVELALALKNFLDAWERPALWAQGERLLDRGLDWLDQANFTRRH